jgi:hypothetical protein
MLAGGLIIKALAHFGDGVPLYPPKEMNFWTDDLDKPIEDVIRQRITALELTDGLAVTGPSALVVAEREGVPYGFAVVSWNNTTGIMDIDLVCGHSGGGKTVVKYITSHGPEKTTIQLHSVNNYASRAKRDAGRAIICSPESIPRKDPDGEQNQNANWSLNGFYREVGFVNADSCDYIHKSPRTHTYSNDDINGSIMTYCPAEAPVAAAAPAAVPAAPAPQPDAAPAAVPAAPAPPEPAAAPPEPAVAPASPASEAAPPEPVAASLSELDDDNHDDELLIFFADNAAERAVIDMTNESESESVDRQPPNVDVIVIDD